MLEPSVVYEDVDFVAVNKPAGMMVHRAKISNFQFPISNYTTLVDWLVKKFPEIKNVGDEPETRPGIVQRLDKETSGIMIVARREGAFLYLKRLFQSREVKKTYLALVQGSVEKDKAVITKPIALKTGTVKRTVNLKGVRMIKEAVTEYRVLKRFNFGGQNFSLLAVQPLTGRTHQIRVHLNSINHPVAGDIMYGNSKLQNSNLKLLNLRRLFLHAESIELTAPSGKRMKLSADLPPDLEQALNLLSGGLADRHLHS